MKKIGQINEIYEDSTKETEKHQENEVNDEEFN